MHSNGDPAQPKINTFLKSAREDVVRRAPSYSVDGNVKWYSHCGEQYGDSLKNQSYYAYILGIYPDKNYNSKRYMHPCVHNSTIHSSQDLETA